ncbi:MAG: hypothetical protein K9N10_00370 [Deltaproteobacteria bacterium]|nr:hypothetical protein [Deltaproteobacteria bacterium]
MQELAIQLDSIDILAITCPSLQDLLYQKLRHNRLLLGKIFGFTNPSLQDLKSGVFYPVPSAKSDFVPHISGVAPCISPSNRDFAPASTVGCPFGPCDILDHSSFFDAAKVFSSHAGNLAGCRIDGFLPEDSEQRDVCNFYLHIGSFGPWLPPPGENHNLIQACLRMCRQKAVPVEMTAGVFC